MPPNETKPQALEPDRALLNKAFDAFESERYSEARSLLLDLTTAGSAYAPHILGYMYEAGKGVQVDVDKAIKWYEESAKLGLLQGMLSLADLLRRSGKESNATTWYEKAAEQGSVSALYWLYVLARANVASGTSKKSSFYLQKAAEQGHVFAMRDMAFRKLCIKDGVLQFHKGIMLLCRSLYKGFWLGYKDPDNDLLR